MLCVKCKSKARIINLDPKRFKCSKCFHIFSEVDNAEMEPEKRTIPVPDMRNADDRQEHTDDRKGIDSKGEDVSELPDNVGIDGKSDPPRRKTRKK